MVRAVIDQEAEVNKPDEKLREDFRNYSLWIIVTVLAAQPALATRNVALIVQSIPLNFLHTLSGSKCYFSFCLFSLFRQCVFARYLTGV